ncbi:carboxypeptidase regulatory-like domain-containing protein [Acidicapsa dinghuensis]|uniref:Carboxypeptidase regulatory-like domain-containing protein n=1 Tax=Acidicapsa dinghuensis TaxID=2218256 RepID=A0ABW1EJ20_9BACT|nr:carboxypeptidase regulatory-like domain-containing protein [Acidicapsa dinghuensis]
MRLWARVLLGLWLAVVPCCGAIWSETVFADDNSSAVASTAGTISGTITDQEGALVPGAKVTITRDGAAPVTVTADEMGRFTVPGLAPGKYTVEAESLGFSKASKVLVVAAGKVQQVILALAIEVQQQQVEVSGTETDASPENNGSAIVIKGAALDSLSEDSDEMTQQLQAIAGSDPESGTQFYVDGFTAGKLPPKSSIREIRINQNPYSAQYDQLGYGRIEIFTKPGTDKLHGDVWMRGNDSPWNAQNPFVNFQPAYHLFLFDGDLNGPINKKASFFTGAYGQNSVNQAIVNAVTLDTTTLQQQSLVQSISTPTTELYLFPRVDWQWGERQTISLRYQLGRNTQTNSGVGQFALASQGLNIDNTEQVLQFSDTQTYGAHVVNETRFQYMRDRNNSTPVSTDVAVNVQGGFTGGGNVAGLTKDNQDHYEFQDYLQMDVGKHDLNMGARLRGVRDSNYSTANFNGQFTFASIAAYQITEQALNICQQTPQNCPTWDQIFAAGGGASQYIQSFGNAGIVASMIDLGAYGEDNWKVTKDVTLSYGLRFESQTQIHDHADFGPRVGVAWAIPGEKNKPPRAVIRTGFGWFYQRFPSANILQAERQNGVTQTEAVVNNPQFFPGTCTGLTGNCAASSAGAPTIYQINPELRAPYTMMGGIGIDKPIGKLASVSATYMWSHGEHLFLTRNINAPLPGTYDPSDPESGTRPMGTDENIYEFESEGASGRNRLAVNGNLHTKHAGLFGYYMLSKAEANTSGVSSFPSNGYDLHDDYGRASYDYRQRLFLGGFTRLPWRFGINPFIVYQSGAPFNITVGQDLNGDTIFNDRPAFATDLTRSSVYATKWGTFDAAPIAGQKIIPIDYGKGPSLFIANLRVNRTFNFGPVVPDPAPPAPAPAKDAKAPAKPVKKEIQRRYTWGFAVASNNVLNHRNLAAPVGVLGSPLFGQSTSLSSMFGAGSPDRTINIETFFQF